MPMDTRDFPIQEPATQFTQNFTQQAVLSYAPVAELYPNVCSRTPIDYTAPVPTA